MGLFDLAEQLIAVRHCRDSRGCRRGRSQVGDKVGDGEVGLMSDTGDDRRLAGGDRVGDLLIVEGP